LEEEDSEECASDSGEEPARAGFGEEDGEEDESEQDGGLAGGGPEEDDGEEVASEEDDELGGADAPPDSLDGGPPLFRSEDGLPISPGGDGPEPVQVGDDENIDREAYAAAARSLADEMQQAAAADGPRVYVPPPSLYVTRLALLFHARVIQLSAKYYDASSGSVPLE
jgi:hypothetical protein